MGLSALACKTGEDEQPKDAAQPGAHATERQYRGAAQWGHMGAASTMARHSEPGEAARSAGPGAH